MKKRTKNSDVIKAGVKEDQFNLLMAPFEAMLSGARDVAVAVSGGGDSMALLYLLSRYVATRVPACRLHVLTVDHGLRAESALEAKQVAAWVKPWPGVTHKILTWRGAKPKTRVAETARAKRYDLMADYCRTNKIQHLFVAHTVDDQAETFLLRLSAGSGVDGLACMRGVDTLSSRTPPLHPPFQGGGRGGDPGPLSALTSAEGPGSRACALGRDDIVLLRPLLSVSHDQLLATLRAAGQAWIEDPTNQNQNYARPRLRAARDVLLREGLTPERLAGTAARMSRARDTIAWALDHAWQMVVESQHTDRLLPLKRGGQGTATAKPARAKTGGGEIRIDRTVFETWPDDIQIRILMRAVVSVGRRAPRLEQIEALWTDMQTADPGRTWRRTVAGAVITRGAKGLNIKPEKDHP